MIKQLRIIFFLTLHPKIKHCCEAPRSMLSNFFGKNQVLRGTFGEIWHIQNQMNLETSFEPKHGAFNLKKQSQCP